MERERSPTDNSWRGDYPHNPAAQPRMRHDDPYHGSRENMKYGRSAGSMYEEERNRWQNTGDHSEDWHNLAKLVDRICFLLVFLAVVALFVMLIVGIVTNKNETPETSKHFQNV